MARSASPRKAYSPAKARNQLLRNQASKCHLYRWGTSTDPYGYLRSAGPFPQRQPAHLLEWAMDRHESWVAIVVACFLDDSNDYYEEMLILPPVDNIALARNGAVIDELISLASQEAKNAGNPRHFVDTLFTLQLKSSALMETLATETWLTNGAAKRAKAVRKYHLGQMIARLEDHISGR